jgi:hypothetical protein
MGDLLTVEVEVSALAGIYATLEKLCEEMAKLRGSLEFSQSEILTLQAENKALTAKVKIHDFNMDCLFRENKVMKETLLRHTKSWHHILSGFPEDAFKNPEGAIREFIQSALKLPIETVNKVAFR